jgi:hypothetical protein
MTSPISDDADTWPPWVNAWPQLTGRQEPAESSWFPGDETEGERAVELATRVGVRPMPWQRQTLGRILSRRPDGLWTHADVVIISPRQSGKSEILV